MPPKAGLGPARNNVYLFQAEGGIRDLTVTGVQTCALPISSKFDAFLAGAYTVTPDEMAGYQLFDGKGNCNSCHVDGRGTTLAPGQTDTSSVATFNPMFTCFGSANEGLPLNPRVAFFYETTPDSFGFT